jgi:uncharacterized protein (TIGR02001 family)
MRYILAAGAFATGLCLSGLASAQDLSVSTGFTATSRYLFYGIEQTTGAAFQPWIEAGYSGFYAGLWASNTSRSITGSSAEVDVYLGYRGEAGPLSFDIGYARYYYVNPSADCCGEAILSLGFAATESLDFGLRVARDPVADYVSTSGTVEFAVTDKVGLNGEYGSVSNGGQDYWSVGATYAFNDSFAVSASWNDTDVTSGLFIVSLDTSFSLR